MPIEIQDVIVNMACKAMIREREEDSLWNTLMVEMHLYNHVKSKWGLGHIKLIFLGNGYWEAYNGIDNVNPIS